MIVNVGGLSAIYRVRKETGELCISLGLNFEDLFNNIFHVN